MAEEKKYLMVSLPPELHERLDAIMKECCFSSIADTIAHLVATYDLFKRRKPPRNGGGNSSSGEKMTDRQVGYIKRLLEDVQKKTGLGFDALREMAREDLGFEITWDMSKEQAAKVIDWLKQQL